MANKAIVTPNGVTCLGYTDLPSRLATQSSTLYSNNLTNLFLSMAKPKGTFFLDPARSALAPPCWSFFSPSFSFSTPVFFFRRRTRWPRR